MNKEGISLAELNVTIEYVNEIWHHSYQKLKGLPYLRREMHEKPKELINTLLLPKLCIIAGMILNCLDAAAEYHRFHCGNVSVKIANLYAIFSDKGDRYAIVKDIYDSKLWGKRYLSSKVYICLYIDLLQSLHAVAIDDKEISLYLVDLFNHGHPYIKRWELFTCFLFDELCKNVDITVLDNDVNRVISPTAVEACIKEHAIDKYTNLFVD